MRPLPADRRPRLLELLEAGDRLAVAAAKMRIPVASVEACSAAFRAQVAAAERHGELLIEGTLLAVGLRGDQRALDRALEMREAARRAESPELDDVTVLELARSIAFILASADPNRGCPAIEPAEPAPPPAPAPEPPASWPIGYAYVPETAQIRRPDGTLAGHSLTTAGAITIALADQARRTAETSQTQEQVQ